MGFPAFNLDRDLLEQAVQSDGWILAGESALSPSAHADLIRWRGMPQRLRDQVLGQIQDYQPPRRGELDGECIWLDMDTRRCLNHEHRPQVCRDFSVGGTGCLEWRNALPQWLEPSGADSSEA